MCQHSINVGLPWAVKLCTDFLWAGQKPQQTRSLFKMEDWFWPTRPKGAGQALLIRWNSLLKRKSLCSTISGLEPSFRVQ